MAATFWGETSKKCIICVHGSSVRRTGGSQVSHDTRRRPFAIEFVETDTLPQARNYIGNPYKVLSALLFVCHALSEASSPRSVDRTLFGTVAQINY